MNALKIEYLPVSELKPYESNPRVHSEKQIAKLIASIQEYGIVLPVLIDVNAVIIAGHAVVKAAQNLHIHELPCIRASHLTEAQTRAYILADNRLAEDSEWDKGLLKSEILRLRDEYGLELGLTGFENREILRLRLDEIDSLKNEDSLPEQLITDPVTELGDIWVLGEHKIICGSCTDPDTVSKLLQNEKPHLMITDPPYGVNYSPEWRSVVNESSDLRTGKVLNDDKSDWREAWALFSGDVAYIWHASKHAKEVIASLEACDFAVRSQIIWAKKNFALSRGEYHWQHECCLYAIKNDMECPEYPGYCPGYESCWYAVREKAKSHWQGSRSESTLGAGQRLLLLNHVGGVVMPLS